MLDPDVKIVKINEEANWTAQGANEPRIRVEFRVGPHGPFVEKFNKAEYDQFKRDTVLNTFAATVRTT